MTEHLTIQRKNYNLKIDFFYFYASLKAGLIVTKCSNCVLNYYFSDLELHISIIQGQRRDRFKYECSK